MFCFCMFLSCLSLAIISILAAQPCEPNHQICSPEGGTSTKSPVDWSSNGALLAEFYEDLVNSVYHQPSKRFQLAKSLDSGASSVNLCCSFNTQCQLLQKFLVPFCWDHFTTNYFLPDNSYGNIASGNYTLASGEMNLITGNFTKLPSQTTGNIYSIGEPPNTSTLHMPTPWTSKGVGIAIPASEVGETSNITVFYSTLTPTTTFPSNNISATMSSSYEVAPHTSTPTEAGVAVSISCGLLGLLPFTLLIVGL